MTTRMFGERVARVEDERLVSGNGAFVGDLGRDALAMAVVRSPHAHAKVIDIDVTGALDVDGLIAIYTYEDLEGPMADRLPLLIPHPALSHGRTQHILAKDEVNYVGEAVVMVVAVDRYVAEDVAERITVEYEPMPAVVGIENARAAAQLVREDVPGNVAANVVQQVGDAEAAIDAAPHVLELDLSIERSAATPMEGRGVLARWDTDSGRLRIWSSTQSSTGVRAAVASKLGLDLVNVTVITPDVGGGFGVKIVHPWPEEVMVAWAARRLERPVKFIEDRREHFISAAERTTETYRREILSKIPVGTWTWEDYAEHDGVDEPKLHTQRITLTRTPDDSPEGAKLIIDFDGTAPQAKGPINHCGDYAEGNFLKKWLAPILRNLADTPERMAELDVNEGIVPLIEMRFPPPGTLLTPIFPAPTNARTFVILRLLGVLAGVVAKAVDGRMPADQETIRYTGVYGEDAAGKPYPMREVLGGGSGGRYYSDGEDTIHVVPDSRNLPSEFTESRFPFRVESLSLAVDSGGAGRYRGGLGYEKQIRMLKDGYFMSIADRSILACWGLKGGKAGKPFSVVIDPGGPDEREVEALTDSEPVVAGEVIRIRTTGGGGWGDPLERPLGEVLQDVQWGKVSIESARADYAAVVTSSGAGLDLRFELDVEASTALRAQRREDAADSPAPFFDRGPGYAMLAAGATSAEVDWL
jgi:N-methylhydantoinase B/oxoprolinase/acetone carboxylase alpha subunit